MTTPQISGDRFTAHGGPPAGAVATRLLVPLDLSDEAPRAVVPAVTLARRLAVPVTLFGWHWDVGEATATRTYLEELRDSLDVDGDVEVTCRDLADAAAAVLDAAARRAGAQVCMATHARSGIGEAVLGSVAEGVVRGSDRPVLLVGPHVDAGAAALDGPVTVSVDSSALSERAIPVGRAWADALGSPLELITVAPRTGAPASARWDPGDVVESGHLAALARRCSSRSWDVLHGTDPAEAIADHVANRSPLVVMGTHGRSGVSRLVLGSVAMKVVHTSTAPVLVVPPSRP